MAKKVLVSGSTGQQGGAVTQALLKKGYQVVGITRNTTSAKSQALANQGVEMISVDFTDHDALVEIMKNVDVVFAMTTPFEGGLDAEMAQGKTMAKAASNAGVSHFVFNSVADANNSTGIPHFDSKYEVEKYLESLDLNYTIVGPTYFIDNILAFNLDGIKNGILAMAMPADRKLQQISVKDIGRFVAYVVEEGEKMYGKRKNIAGDEISGSEIAQILSQKLNKEIQYQELSPEIVRQQSEDMALMYEWFDSDGYTTDMEEMKEYGFLNFNSWVDSQDLDSFK